MIGLAFFVYIRPWHTRKVIESIRKNKFEKIYIFQDGLKNQKDAAAWHEVSKMIQAIDFVPKEVFISDRNKGLANSIVEGMNYVFQYHDFAIALEDDVILADEYKDLMEELSKNYKGNRRVMSVCGGGYGTIVPEDYPYDIYFTYRMSSVAFGTWKDRWAGYERNPMLLKKILADPEKKKFLEYAGGDVEQIILASVRGSADTWAAYWVLHQIDHLAFHAIPVLGYAKDIGRDGTGTNTTHEICRYDIALDGNKKEQYRLPEEAILDEHIVEDTMDIFRSGDKFLTYFNILCDWVKLKQDKTEIWPAQYFINKGINAIYVYGTGKIAELLTNEISRYISIEGYIVENKQFEEFMGGRVFDLTETSGIRAEYPIIITPTYDIGIIRHMFRKCHIQNEMVMFEDILAYGIALCGGQDGVR